jgi:hypothetical protein
MGRLNRYSGAAKIDTYKDIDPTDTYVLTCKPAKPLF